MALLTELSPRATNVFHGKQRTTLPRGSRTKLRTWCFAVNSAPRLLASRTRQRTDFTYSIFTGPQPLPAPSNSHYGPVNRRRLRAPGPHPAQNRPLVGRVPSPGVPNLVHNEELPRGPEPSARALRQRGSCQHRHEQGSGSPLQRQQVAINFHRRRTP